MIIICAWCNKVLGDKLPIDGKHKTEKTHGICHACFTKEFNKYLKEKETK